MKRIRSGSYGNSIRAASKTIQVVEDGATEEGLRALIHGAVEDLLEKREVDDLNSKDLGALLKLVESHTKLEKLELEREKATEGSATPEQILATLEKFKQLEAANELSED